MKRRNTSTSAGNVDPSRFTTTSARRSRWAISSCASRGGSRHPSSPDSRHETLGPSHVRLVFLPELLPHHSLLGPDSESEYEGPRAAVGRTRNPVGDHEGLADR